MRTLILLAMPLLLAGCHLFTPGSSSPKLAETDWVVDAFVINGERIKANADETLTLTFTDERQATAEADCNNCAGGYTVQGEAITFTLGCTDLACEAPTQGDLLQDALRDVTSYERGGGELVLFGPSVNVILRAQR
ncbi:MAG: META domain-containing protein [Bacteroidota bacterium]